MDELLDFVSRDVADGRYAAVVSTSGALLDPVVAGLGSEAVELIVDADDAERAAALAIATSRAAHAAAPQRRRRRQECRAAAPAERRG